jgi:hypothetical protein
VLIGLAVIVGIVLLLVTLVFVGAFLALLYEYRKPLIVAAGVLMGVGGLVLWISAGGLWFLLIPAGFLTGVGGASL